MRILWMLLKKLVCSKCLHDHLGLYKESRLTLAWQLAVWLVRDSFIWFYKLSRLQGKFFLSQGGVFNMSIWSFCNGSDVWMIVGFCFDFWKYKAACWKCYSWMVSTRWFQRFHSKTIWFMMDIGILEACFYSCAMFIGIALETHRFLSFWFFWNAKTLTKKRQNPSPSSFYSC